MRSPRSKPINVTFLAETPRFFRKLAGRSARGVVQDGNSPGLTTFIKSAYLPLACQIVLIASSISGSKGALTIFATETGGDVVFSGSGSLNLSDLHHHVGGGALPGINPTTESVPVLVLGPPDNQVDEYGWADVSVPAPFGTGGHVPATSGTGDVFGTTVNIEAPGEAVIWVPSGYVSGSWLSGSIAFSSETFATLGLIPGIYTWSWGSGENADSMTLIIPEPSAGLLSLLGLGLLMKRRR